MIDFRYKKHLDAFTIAMINWSYARFLQFR